MPDDLPSLATNTDVAEVADAIDEAIEAVEESVEEVKDIVEGIDLDSLASKIADAVYDKTRKLVADLMEATEDAAAIVDEVLTETAPATEEATPEPDEEDEEDVKPKTGHPMFKKPLKKER
jgi:methyl-accepting chemotaxis protein